MIPYRNNLFRIGFGHGFGQGVNQGFHLRGGGNIRFKLADGGFGGLQLGKVGNGCLLLGVQRVVGVSGGNHLGFLVYRGHVQSRDHSDYVIHLGLPFQLYNGGFGTFQFGEIGDIALLGIGQSFVGASGGNHFGFVFQTGDVQRVDFCHNSIGGGFVGGDDFQLSHLGFGGNQFVVVGDQCFLGVGQVVV